MPGSTVSVSPLAQQHQAVITIPYEELRTRFDKYWKEHSKALVDRFNVKLERKKEGRVDFSKAQKILEKTIKPNKLYRETLIDIFMEKLDEFSGQKGSVLFLESIRLSGFDNSDQDSFLVGMFYYAPELELLEEIDFVAEKPFKENWGEIWGKKIENLQHKHRITAPCEEDVYISESMHVLIDIHASSDGKPDPNLSLKLKWLEVSRIESNTFKTELCKHKKGDTFDVIYEVGDDGEKEASAQVKIHEMEHITYPEITDELIKKSELSFGDKNFETLDEYMQSELKRYREYLDSVLANAATSHILNQIATKSKIPPAPMGWINNVAKQGMEKHVSQSGGDTNKAMKSIGAASESDMLNLFCDQANNEYVRHLATRKYASMYDMEYTDSDALVADMASKMKWKVTA